MFDLVVRKANLQGANFQGASLKGAKLDGDDLVVTRFQAGPRSVHHGKSRGAGQLGGPCQWRETAIGYRHLSSRGAATGNEYRRQGKIIPLGSYLDVGPGLHAGAGEVHLEGWCGPVIGVDDQRAAEGFSVRGSLSLIHI